MFFNWRVLKDHHNEIKGKNKFRELYTFAKKIASYHDFKEYLEIKTFLYTLYFCMSRKKATWNKSFKKKKEFKKKIDKNCK